MKRLDNKITARYIAIAVLALSAMTATLPREFFDPHLGLDIDIFCISYVTFVSDVPVAETRQLVVGAEDDYDFDQFIDFFHILYVVNGIPIRAPPL